MDVTKYKYVHNLILWYILNMGSIQSKKQSNDQSEITSNDDLEYSRGTIITGWGGKHAASFTPYIYRRAKGILKVDPDVKLEVKASSILSTFTKDKHLGLYTQHPIQKDTIVCAIDDDLSGMINDGVVNLEPLIEADTSKKYYRAWVNFEKTYYNLSKAKKLVNVRVVADDVSIYYETIKDIPRGRELTQMYGFTLWIFELFDLLTNRNLAGFVKFINKFAHRYSGDLLVKRINILNETLARFVPDIHNIKLSHYDAIEKDSPLRYIGYDVESLYMENLNLAGLS